jgi:hypothetical protein
MKIKYDRLIIDEFHEIFDKGIKKIYENISKITTKYKWAITATPLINSEMIYNIMNFIATNKIKSVNVTKYKRYLNIFADMFRQNTKKSVEVELFLPKVNEHVYKLTLTPSEVNIYNSLNINMHIHRDDLITRQLKFCINPAIYFMDNTGKNTGFVPINVLTDMVVNMHKGEYEQTKISIINNIMEVLNKFYNKETLAEIKSDDDVFQLWKTFNKDHIRDDMSHEYISNIKYINKSCADLLTIKSKMDFFEEQTKLLDKKVELFKHKHTSELVKYVLTNGTKSEVEDCTKTEVEDGSKVEEDCGGVEEAKTADPESDSDSESDDDNCAICMGIISEDCTMLECGHIYCTGCIQCMLTRGLLTCPMCQKVLTNTKFYSPMISKKRVPKLFEKMIEMYGTKISHLINIIKTKLVGKKIIVYCDSPSLITNLVTILNENDISSITPTNSISISDTIKAFELSHNVMILSSDFNASGLNCQFADTVIILQPIRGDYTRRKQIDNQILGRVHRIGLLSEITLIRIIINDTIESEIDRENTLIDMLHETEREESIVSEKVTTDL